MRSRKACFTLTRTVSSSASAHAEDDSAVPLKDSTFCRKRPCCRATASTMPRATISFSALLVQRMYSALRSSIKLRKYLLPGCRTLGVPRPINTSMGPYCEILEGGGAASESAENAGIQGYILLVMMLTSQPLALPLGSDSDTEQRVPRFPFSTYCQTDDSIAE